MRIGIIGQPCIDEVILPGHIGEPLRSIGGIFYSYAAMERLMLNHGVGDDRFVPLTWLCNTDQSILVPFLDQLSHLDQGDGVWSTAALTNRVQLIYPEVGERTEHCPNVLPPLTRNELTTELVDSLDGLFVNMISGFDVSVSTLDEVLSKVKRKPWVHLDVHALVLGQLSNGNDSTFGTGRRPQGVKDWKQWLALCDSVQLNELEVRWFGNPEVTDEEHFLQYLKAKAQHLRYLIITRGVLGATLYDLTDGTIHHVPSPKTQVVNPTGAGDVFGSAFIYSLLNNNEASVAIRNAVEWASWSTTVHTIEELLTAVK